jgi:hypothetical protein
MVINHPSSVDYALEMSIPFVFVQFKLQCFHASILPQINGNMTA